MIMCVCNTKDDADLLIDLISQAGGVPRVGVNAKTGEPEPGKQKTVKYAESRERLDGKWFFPAVPDELMAQYPQEVIESITSQVEYTLEEYSNDWEKQIEIGI